MSHSLSKKSSNKNNSNKSNKDDNKIVKRKVDPDTDNIENMGRVNHPIRSFTYAVYKTDCGRARQVRMDPNYNPYDYDVNFGDRISCYSNLEEAECNAFDLNLQVVTAGIRILMWYNVDSGLCDKYGLVFTDEKKEKITVAAATPTTSKDTNTQDISVEGFNCNGTRQRCGKSTKDDYMNHARFEQCESLREINFKVAKALSLRNMRIPGNSEESYDAMLPFISKCSDTMEFLKDMFEAKIPEEFFGRSIHMIVRVSSDSRSNKRIKTFSEASNV